MSLQAIKFDTATNKLTILDQRELPHFTVWLNIDSTEKAFEAIKNMSVRGAPAIAIVAALALASEVVHKEFDSVVEIISFVVTQAKYLIGARPTAVNLSKAMNEIIALVTDSSSGSSVEGIQKSVLNYALVMLDQDVKTNKSIGDIGADWFISKNGSQKFSIITICNTGSLATAGYGTALGVIRSLHAKGALERVYCLETRPYNQGSRLTAYELVHDGIPATLICDSMVASLCREHPEIRGAVVGADRVAYNGDTANKIGTFQLALLAKHFDIPFTVAAPTTSIDPLTAAGREIVIEQRPSTEVAVASGPIVKLGGNGITVSHDRATVSTAAAGIDIWNPSFDVTPNKFIDAIFTEKEAVEDLETIGARV